MKNRSICALAALTLVALTARLLGASHPPLAGTWLVESSSWESARDLARAKVVLTEHTFSLTGYRRQDRPWAGTYMVAGECGLDFHIDGFEVGLPRSTKIRVPATDVHAAFKIERIEGVDHLTICYPLHSDQSRPTKFDESAGADDPRLIKLVRADAGFVDFPKDVTITVLNPDGTPAVDAYPFERMQHFPAAVSKDGGKTFRADLSQPQKWSYWGDTSLRSDAKGEIHLPFTTFENQDGAPVGIRDDSRNLTAFFYPSAALLERGAFTVRLSAVRIVEGSVRPDVDVPFFSPMASLGPAEYWADKGKFEFPVPPGTYLLSVYGMELYSSRKWITVPDGHVETPVNAGKLVVHVSQGPSLIGKPAPRLEGIVAWKNGPIELKDLRGKIVLVNFWGYWCGGCVNEMPTLIHLYDKYKDKGLAIVGVHVDAGGEVDTVAKLDERTARYRNGFWRGRDVPFPTALTSGQAFGNDRSRAGAGYGITGYPTTVIIGRNGQVLGGFIGSDPPSMMTGSNAALDLSNDAAADASVEALLKSAP